MPICILRDSMREGRRIHRIAHNDVLFRPNSKPVAKSVGSELGEFSFTSYHYHEGVEILRIMEGECRVVINNKTYPAKAGDVLFVNPFEAHGIYLDSRRIPFSRDCVSFLPEKLFPDGSAPEYLKNAVFDSVCPKEASAEINAAVERIVSAASGGRAGWALSALGSLMELYSSATCYGALRYEGREQPQRAEFMARVSDYIEANLASDISTADAAAFCQYTPEHFCRLFKRSFGATFVEYLNVYRIQRAKEYVDRGNYPSVSELASRFGFTSQNHFGNTFKKRTGTLPSVYIKEKRKENRS